MNNYDKQLLKTAPTMIKGIAIQSAHLNGKKNMSLSLEDVYSMVEFGSALGGQISEADNVNTGKLISECIIGGVLLGILLGLLAAYIANR